MTTSELFDLMSKVNLGYADWREQIENAPEIIQYAFFKDARCAYDQAADDPHKWGDMPQTIVNAIDVLPVMESAKGKYSYADAQANEVAYGDLFVAAYKAKWGVEPTAHLVERETENFLITFA